MGTRDPEQPQDAVVLDPQERIRESLVGWVVGIGAGGLSPLPIVPTEARVDGKRVVLEGRDEVVLRCGKASLTLRRDGQVLLRGVNIRTDAEAVHRIRGGKVQIN